jgi:hypothetical protein
MRTTMTMMTMMTTVAVMTMMTTVAVMVVVVMVMRVREVGIAFAMGANKQYT